MRRIRQSGSALFQIAGAARCQMKGIGRYENRHHELSEISHSLKHLAGQLDVTMVLLSQLNRECEKEKRPPRLADLKETGSRTPQSGRSGIPD